jgi:hypothetical protein
MRSWVNTPFQIHTLIQTIPVTCIKSDQCVLNSWPNQRLGTSIATHWVGGFDMVNRLKRTAAAVFVALTLLGATSFAQGLHKKVYFSINVPYRLQMGDYILRPGTYTLRQVSPNDVNLFFMFEGRDRRGTPIAAIRTVRVDRSVHGSYPDDAQVQWKIDESSVPGKDAVITGWDIPGEDGWEIISVRLRRSSPAIVAMRR